MPWSPSARARQAALTRKQKPWRRSTGPRTATGKSRSARNADKGLCTPQLREIATHLRSVY